MNATWNLPGKPDAPLWLRVVKAPGFTHTLRRRLVSFSHMRRSSSRDSPGRRSVQAGGVGVGELLAGEPGLLRAHHADLYPAPPRAGHHQPGARAGRGSRGATAPRPPPRPPPRTKWTRRVPHPVLIGHAASLNPRLSRFIFTLPPPPVCHSPPQTRAAALRQSPSRRCRRTPPQRRGGGVRPGPELRPRADVDRSRRVGPVGLREHRLRPGN
jgi:hypothetical protein